MSGTAIVVLEAIAPLLILIVYVRIKNIRSRRKAVDADPVQTRPYEPKPEPAPGFFLSHFSTPQRAYLRQQIALGKGCYYIVAWIFIVALTSGLLPPFVNAYGLQQPLAQRVWYSYLEHISIGEALLGIVILMAVIIAVSGLATGAQAIFNCTRPLTHRFIFWARILPAIATVIVSLATAIAVSVALLLIFYGPVWLHLLDTLEPSTVLSREQEMHLIQSLQTSAPRLFLSLTTTMLLIFSAAVLFFILGSWFPKKSSGKTLAIPAGVVGGIVAVQLIHALKGTSDSLSFRMFFWYSGHGSPPPYAYALVPVLASAALLFIAQLLIRRVEL